MIIHDFNIMKIVLSFNRKTNPILVINTNAVLSLSVALERLQAVCRRNPQILQTSCIFNHDQFPQRHTLDIMREFLGKDLIVDLLRFFVREALYHTV